jgi:hypothetical protein
VPVLSSLPHSSFQVARGRGARGRVLAFLAAALILATSMLVYTAAQPRSVLAADPADPAQTTITASAASVSVDDGATIIVQAKDGTADLTTGGDAVILNSTGASAVSSPIDNGDGTYTATLNDSSLETATVSGTINGDPITSGDAVITFTPGAPVGAQSTITPSTTSASVDDSSPTVIVQARDQYGNLVTADGATVVLSNDNTGPLAVSDNHDGTYAATVIETVAPQTDTISGSIDGDPISTGDAIIDFTVGAASTDTTTIVASPPSVIVDIHLSTITVTAKDQFGNDVGAGGSTVTLDSPNGTLTPVDDIGNGTYTATIEDTVSRLDTITGKLGVVDIADDATVDFTPGALKFFVIGHIDPQIAGTAFDVVITAEDQYHNIKTNYGGTPTISGLAASPGCVGCSPTLGAISATYGSITFTNGVATVSVTAFGADASSHITVTDASPSTTQDSNTFAVTHVATLGGFTIENLSAAVAGTPFIATFHAFDPYGNVYTDYSSGTLSNLSNSPGCTACVPSLLVATPTYGALIWSGGSATANITAVNAQTGAQLKIQGATASRLSNGFTVTNKVQLKGLTINAVASPLTAGAGFNVTVRAFDVYGNVYIGYGGAAALGGLATSPGCSGCTPALVATAPTYGTPSWTNGVGTYTGVLAYKAQSGATLTATDVGAIVSNSTTFDVQPASALKGFTTAAIGSTQTAAIAFSLAITPYDLYGNVKLDYVGSPVRTGLANSPGCSSPSCSTAIPAAGPSYGPYTGTGVRSSQVTPFNSQASASVTVTDGAIANTTNSFTVLPSTETKLLFSDASVAFNGQPINTKLSQPIYSSCLPPTSVTANPCKLPTQPGPTSSALKVLAIDNYGNRVAGVGVTITSANPQPSGASIVPGGTRIGTTAGGTPGVAPYGEVAYDTITIGTLNSFTLTAKKSGTSLPADSQAFTVVSDLRACDGGTCDNTASTSSGTPLQKAYGKISTGNDFYNGTTTNVILTTQFVNKSAFASKCDGLNSNNIIGQGTDLQVQGLGVTVTAPGTDMLLIIPKDTIKANGITARSAISFNVCLGALWIDQNHTAAAWHAKKVSGSGPGVVTFSDGRYWGTVADCGATGIGLTLNDPCIKLKTKQAADVKAYFGFTTAQINALMKDSDVAIVIHKPFPWDGKGGTY